MTSQPPSPTVQPEAAAPPLQQEVGAQSPVTWGGGGGNTSNVHSNYGHREPGPRVAARLSVPTHGPSSLPGAAAVRPASPFPAWGSRAAQSSPAAGLAGSWCTGSGEGTAPPPAKGHICTSRTGED